MILPLESLVPDRETCERLKAAGFDQDGTYFAWWCRHTPTSGMATGEHREYVLWDNTQESDWEGRFDERLCAAPLAAEIMEELRQFKLDNLALEQEAEGYDVSYNGGMFFHVEYGPTAAQALALLWEKVVAGEAEHAE